MTVYGFHASHEQVHPSELVAAVVRAEEAGFEAAMCSDHFSPWSARQGESGFAWAWLGAAMQATALPFGVVTAPGQRYHPAITAQAIGTLAAMYPGRFWAALGSGEASNEHITGGGWPRKDVRNARLLECAGVIRALLAGEEVSHDGLVTVDRARLWTRPETPPPLVGAAVSAETARWCAGWADGLITVNAPHDHLRRVIGEYRDAGGRGKVCLQVHLSWAETEDEALAIAHHQWRSNVFPPPVCWDVETAEVFDAISEHVTPQAVAKAVYVSADPGRHAAWLAELAALGFDEVYLHHVGREQSAFIDAFGEKVLPRLEGNPS
ncbi:TIGR03885 family FMN-dependent LLM class oxidoreductase [Bailinhaonella thermotolerans]|uniref:TIGR03557 family F420-dependent LLM class oxidoreductase n=1 Tax=Bailinhaonella thermotolerans TaxID=1070861 RepID=A0A3A4BWN5_9ACTN|nr:TIGR03885 family FMN-dependent LLM class oxidoreductase [Bailinhaonella thermotolerans]RJL35998.1 TIGR03557 family F420-dependent LLM class oxidoreductase [Bailinhaonella thermotolerans]